MADNAEAPGAEQAENDDGTNGVTPETSGQDQESGAEGAQEDDFDAAFGEAVASLAPAKTDDIKQVIPPAEEGDEDEGRADNAPPAPAAKTPPAPAPGDKPAAGADVPDILKDASPEIRKLFEDQHAEAERFRKRAEGLERRVRGFTKAAPPASAPAKSEEEKKAETDAQKRLDEQLDTLGKDFPEIAGPILELLKTQSQQIDALRGAVTPITEAASQEAQDAAAEVLAEKHPDFLEYGDPADPEYKPWLAAQSPEYQERNKRYRSWLATQPPGVRKLDGSWDPEENIILINLYKTSTGHEAQTKGGNPPPDPKPDTATNDKRRRQMDGGADVRSRAAPVAAGATDDDFAGAFAEAEAKLKRR